MSEVSDKAKEILTHDWKEYGAGAHVKILDELTVSYDQLLADARELQKALETVLNQPFNGSWDSQAVFVQNVLVPFTKKYGSAE